jgi:hypothetical protein
MGYEKDTNNTLKSKYIHQRATPFINVHKLTNTPPLTLNPPSSKTHKTGNGPRSHDQQNKQGKTVVRKELDIIKCPGTKRPALRVG